MHKIEMAHETPYYNTIASRQVHISVVATHKHCIDIDLCYTSTVTKVLSGLHCDSKEEELW